MGGLLDHLAHANSLIDAGSATYERAYGVLATRRGPVSAPQLHAHLSPVLDADVCLVSDTAIAYRWFAREVHITHEAVNVSAGGRVRGAIHFQTVNVWHGRDIYAAINSRNSAVTSTGSAMALRLWRERRLSCV